MYSLDIPGQVSEFQLKAIEAVAVLAPKSGTVVEVGSLFGRSSFAWAKSVDVSTQVFCIDPWEGNKGIHGMEERLGITYGLEQFQIFTQDCSNIVPLKGYSPKDFRSWNRSVDIYYEDAVHVNPTLRENLTFWSSFVKDTGVICGDDYRPRFPDVVCEVNRLAKKLNRDLIVVDNFWCLLPTVLSPEAQQVAKDLQILRAKFWGQAYETPPIISVQSSHEWSEIDRGSAITIPVSLTNETRRPLTPSHSILELVLRICHKETDFVIEEGLPLEPFLFQPDIAGRVEFLVQTDSAFPKGEYYMEAFVCDSTTGAAIHKPMIKEFGNIS